MCCAGHYPMALSDYTANHATSINLTSLGAVVGHVAQAGTGQGVFFAASSTGGRDQPERAVVHGGGRA